MIELNADTYADDLKRLEMGLIWFQKEIPFALAYTLTQMGQAGKAAIKDALPRVFDRPTPWTMNSTLLRGATKTRQEAVVWIKDGSVSSLAHHITGGRRPAKRFEKRLRSAGVLRGSNQYAVPAKRMKLNRYGNLTMGRINKLLSATGSQYESQANSSNSSIKTNSGQGRIFVVPRGKRTPPGIYQVKGSGADRNLLPMMIFVKKTNYRRRFHFHEITEDAGYDAIPGAIDKSLARVFG